MNRVTWRLACGMGAALFLVIPARPAAAQGPDLAGSWALNRSQSDDPREMMREMRGRRANPGAPSGTRAGPGARPGQRMGGRGTGGGGPSLQGMRQAMRAAMVASERVVLVQDASSVTVTYTGQTPRTLTTDGKKWREEVGDGVEVEFKAEWKDGELRVEREFEGGAKLKETYRLSPDGEQLYVVTRVEVRRMPEPMEFRRVYDRTTS